MRRSHRRVRSITVQIVIFALCFGLAGIQPAYAATLAEALDTTLAVTTGGNAAWFGVDSALDSHDGVDVGVSGDIADYGTSSFEITVTGPGRVTYWSQTDSEPTCDFLRVYLDDVRLGAHSTSGDTFWVQRMVAIPAGSHTVRWAYEKDFSVSVGADAVYVDQVTFVNDPPVGRVDGAHLAGNAVPLTSWSPEAEAYSGFAVGISDGVLAVGANWDDTTQANAGSVTVYRRANGAWDVGQLITSPVETASGFFGTDLALDSGLLAVCEPNLGRIHAYSDNGTAFVPYGATITAPAGASDFGGSLAISNGTIVTGAQYSGAEFQGRAYVYTYTGGAWTLQQAINAPDVAVRDFFGRSVDIEGDTLIIGAPGHDHAGEPGGAAYVYTRSGGEWTLESELHAPGGVAGTAEDANDLGISVGISNGTAIAGARNRHLVYVYTKPGGVWALTDILRRPTEQATTYFGSSAAIDGDTILAGDAGYDLSAYGGSVFAYQRSNDFFFDHVETLHSGVPSTFGAYGDAVAIDGGQFAVGERLWDGPSGANQGRALVYEGAYYRVKAGGILTVGPAMGVVANDIEPNGDTVSVYTFNPPTSGTIDYISPQGGFGYTATNPSPAEVPWGYTPMDTLGALGAGTNAYITVAPAPTGTPSINNFSHGSPVRDIPIELSSLGNVRMFRIRIGTGAWSAWQRLTNPAQTVQLPAAAGAYDIQVEVMGSGGNVVHSWSVTYPTTLTRFPGTDRYHTAILASQSAYPTGSCSSVILATGMNYPDALAAAGLGGAVNAPVILINGAKVRADVLAEIKRLTQGRPSFTVYIMGGTAAVPTALENSIKASLTGESVVRFAGTDRFHTARLVAVKIKALLGASFGRQALLVPGMDFADGLMVGPGAYARKAPILLVRASADADLVTTLKALGTTELTVCGSLARIPVATENALKAAIPGLIIYRAGSAADVYARSAEAAEYFAGQYNDYSLRWTGVGVATAERYPDGLSAGCIDGKAGTPLLLTKVASLPASISAKLAAHKGTVGAVRYYGGDAAVAPAVRTAVTNALK